MAGTANGIPISVSFRAMGTEVSLALWPNSGDEEPSRVAIQHAAAFVRYAERRLSRFLDGSEITRLNSGTPEPVSVSTLTYNAIAVALQAAEATGGLFDPTIHDALVAAGYDRSFDELKSAAIDRVATAPATTSRSCGRYQQIRLDRRTHSVWLPEGVRIGLGGIAKGWLADQIVRRLSRHGAALADLGGDIAVRGLPLHEAAWRVSLAVDDPSIAVLGQIALLGGGVATSGVTRRRWQTAQGWRHHLIDPRTGQPVVTDLISASVVAPSAAVAEAAAKAVLLLGCEAGAEALDRTPGLGGVLVRTDGSVRTAGPIAWQPTPAGEPCPGVAS